MHAGKLHVWSKSRLSPLRSAFTVVSVPIYFGRSFQCQVSFPSLLFHHLFGPFRKGRCNGHPSLINPFPWCWLTMHRKTLRVNCACSFLSFSSLRKSESKFICWKSGDVLLSIIYSTCVLIRQTVTEVVLLLLIMQTLYRLIGLFIIWYDLFLF